MPQFFFDIDDNSHDSTAVDLPGRKSVRSEAIRAAGEMLRDLDGALSGEQWKMTVRDERGHMVLEILFSVVETPRNEL